MYRLTLILCVTQAACTHRAVVNGDDVGPGPAPDLGVTLPDRGPPPLDWPRQPDTTHEHHDGSPPDMLQPDAKKPGKCAPGTKLVYVVDSANKLYLFFPTSKKLSYLGKLSCPLPGSPYSMAVRHDGVAFVLYGKYNSSNTYTCQGLGRLDVKTLKCTRAKAFSCKTTKHEAFGMGYVVTGPAGAEELFIGTTGKSLATLDPDTGKMKTIGTLPSAAPEFAGNAGGELWGFFPRVAPARVRRIDPKTGKILKTHTLTKFNQPWAGSYAFAMYKNVFYVFYGASYGSSTNVFRLTKAGALSTWMTNTGINIVGAGVSTCAN